MENLEMGRDDRGRPARLEKRTSNASSNGCRCWPSAAASFARHAVRRGQQQMLAIGRGLASSPKLLMLDEPSMGLSAGDRRFHLRNG